MTRRFVIVDAKGIAVAAQGRLVFGAYVPAAKLVVFDGYRPSDSCPINTVDAISVP
jgi:hypothetical protein